MRKIFEVLRTFCYAIIVVVEVKGKHLLYEEEWVFLLLYKSIKVINRFVYIALEILQGIYHKAKTVIGLQVK